MHLYLPAYNYLATKKVNILIMSGIEYSKMSTSEVLVSHMVIVLDQSNFTQLHIQI